MSNLKQETHRVYDGLNSVGHLAKRRLKGNLRIYPTDQPEVELLSIGMHLPTEFTLPVDPSYDSHTINLRTGDLSKQPTRRLLFKISLSDIVHTQEYLGNDEVINTRSTTILNEDVPRKGSQESRFVLKRYLDQQVFATSRLDGTTQRTQSNQRSAEATAISVEQAINQVSILKALLAEIRNPKAQTALEFYNKIAS